MVYIGVDLHRKKSQVVFEATFGWAGSPTYSPGWASKLTWLT